MFDSKQKKESYLLNDSFSKKPQRLYRCIVIYMEFRPRFSQISCVIYVQLKMAMIWAFSKIILR